VSEDDIEELSPICCKECDKEITYSARHWDMIGKAWYCMDCWPAQPLEKGWLSGDNRS
jgi:hypothetical protein